MTTCTAAPTGHGENEILQPVEWFRHWLWRERDPIPNSGFLATWNTLSLSCHICAIHTIVLKFISDIVGKGGAQKDMTPQAGGDVATGWEGDLWAGPLT